MRCVVLNFGSVKALFLYQLKNLGSQSIAHERRAEEVFHASDQ